MTFQIWSRHIPRIFTLHAYSDPILLIYYQNLKFWDWNQPDFAIPPMISTRNNEESQDKLYYGKKKGKGIVLLNR